MAGERIEVHRGDLEKVYDALDNAVRHHKARDEMNAALHLAAPRYSPLASQLEAAKERIGALLPLDTEAPDA